MTATLNTAVYAGEDVSITSVQQLGNSDTGPCIINVAVTDSAKVEVGIRETVTAAEILTALSSSMSSSGLVGMSGPLVTVTIPKDDNNVYKVPNNINGMIVLGMVLANITLSTGDVVTEILIGIGYDPVTYHLNIPTEDMDYLEAIGEIASFTISYIEKVVV